MVEVIDETCEIDKTTEAKRSKSNEVCMLGMMRVFCLAF